MKNTKNNLKGSIILLTAAFLWGMAFVAQTTAANKGVPPFAFNCFRSLIGSAFLALLLFFKKLKTKTAILPKEKKDRTQLFLRCAFCGLLLSVSVNLQQVGLDSYPDGVAASARGGFLTAVYVILVPLASLFFGKRVQWPVWLAVLAATGGVYLLSMSGGFDGIYLGDVLMLGCAFSFTFHILTVDRFCSEIDGMLLCCIQFLVVFVTSGLISLFAETVVWSSVADALPEILYLGICSSGIAYTLQIYGQSFAEPAVASLSMSFESVFGALGGCVILHDTLSAREIIGCCVMFCAIILAQLPEMLNKEKKQ